MPKAKSAASSRRRDRQEQRRELKRAGGAVWRMLGTDPRRGSPTVACASSRPEEGGRSALTLPRARLVFLASRRDGWTQRYIPTPAGSAALVDALEQKPSRVHPASLGRPEIGS